MAAGNFPLYSFNRGLVSRFALARTDLKRMALSASVMENWMPRALGSMMLRPGTTYINTVGIAGTPKHAPFVFSDTSTAILQFGEMKMRVLVNEALVTRVAVSTAITNGTFAVDLTGWTDADQSGCTSMSGVPGLTQKGNGVNYAIVRQQVTVAGGDIGKEHALRFVVVRGPVTIRVGSGSGAQDYIQQTDLDAGTHSLAFTPTGNFWVQIMGLTDTTTNLFSVAVEGAGVMEIPTIWPAASLPTLRWDQSADVVYFANDGYLMQKVERRAVHSWSVTRYFPVDGPFDTPNTTGIVMTPAAISGDTTVTASQSVFRAAHLGALLLINSVGQEATAALSGANQSTDWIKVTGAQGARNVAVNISGTFSGTITLQRSVAVPDIPENTSQTWTAPVSGFSYYDGLDNQIIYYRLTMTAYTSGTANVKVSNPSGTQPGIGEITQVNSETNVNVRVWDHFGALRASSNWAFGLWSPDKGYPTSTRLYQGRLWWLGRGNIIGSVSGAYASFDQTIEGDSGPIVEQIGSGPVDVINWAIATQRLVVGAESREITVRSSAINEPLTPTDFNLVDVSTLGSAPVDAAKVDTNIFFVQEARQHIVKMVYQPSYFGLDYSSQRQTEIDPDLGLDGGGFQQVVVQRKPDTRVHCRLADGTVAIFVYDEAEDVQAWVKFRFGGLNPSVVDMFVLPGGDGEIEDRVYYVISYGGAYLLVRWARQDECVGGTLNKQADGCIIYSGSPTTTISGIPFNDGTVVVVWADGKSLDNPDGSLATFTVAGGAITLPSAVSNAVVGLNYTASFLSTKLAYAAQLGTALIQPKRIAELGVILADSHPRGLQYGPDLDHLRSLPLVYKGKSIDPTATMAARDDIAFTFNGTWDTDSRLALQAQAPRPCTVLAAIMSIETVEQ